MQRPVPPATGGGDTPTAPVAGPSKRLVIISNRLPIRMERNADGELQLHPSAGGLATAMAPVLRDRGGVWIGWPGMTAKTATPGQIEAALDAETETIGYDLKPVTLTVEEHEQFYYGFSNEILWPLFHDLFTRCNFKPAYWRMYQQVNSKFAAAALQNIEPGDYVWVHDYHLMNLAHVLREAGVDAPLGFFLHIPFPSLDIFLKLPWRFEILRNLLQYDLLGFQTRRDRSNFTHCVRRIFKNAEIFGRGNVITCRLGGRDIKIGSFPISIDYKHFVSKARSSAVEEKAWYIHEDLPDRQLILGIDRLDYTKGIPERLRAFQTALDRYPDLHGKVTMIQIVTPSRSDIPEYQSLKTEIERLVGQINGTYTLSGWVPIHYIHRRLSFTELVGYYRSAEVALITSLKDGMNLIAKEFCACSLEEDSVLVLSEFAGAASQLHIGALLVNPYDSEGTARAIHEAVMMPRAERKRRMKKLRRSIRRKDIFWWVNQFLRQRSTEGLESFPQREPVTYAKPFWDTD